jgi:hypothetical protein
MFRRITEQTQTPKVNESCAINRWQQIRMASRSSATKERISKRELPSDVISNLPYEFLHVSRGCFLLVDHTQDMLQI